MQTPKIGLNEAHYLWSIRQCNFEGIKVYPINVSGFYHIQIDDNGWIWISAERYKPKARFKKDRHWDIEVLKIYQTIQIIKQMKKQDVLEEAAGIIYNRENNKARDYGPFHDSMRDAAKIMTILTGKSITTLDFYKAMMSLKLARLQHSDKYDTYLDLIAYIASASTLKDEPLIEKDID